MSKARTFWHGRYENAKTYLMSKGNWKVVFFYSHYFLLHCHELAADMQSMILKLLSVRIAAILYDSSELMDDSSKKKKGYGLTV